MFEGGGIFAEEFAAPPIAVYALGAQVGEPVLVNYGADLARRRAGERIFGEKLEYGTIIFNQAFFSPNDETGIPPGAERSKPQIPIEARLIGGVNSRSFVNVLRLIAEGIRGPGFSVLRALEFNFVAAVSHDGEKAVAIGDAKRFDRAQRRLRKRHGGKQHPDKLRSGAIKDEGEAGSGNCSAQRGEAFAPSDARDFVFGGCDRRRRFVKFQRGYRFDAVTDCARDDPFDHAVVKQEEAQQENHIIQESVICGEDNGNFERRDDAKTENTKTPGEKKQPNEDEFSRKSVENGGGVKPVRQLLDVPANPSGERAVLVIVVHGGELAPGNVAAGDFGHA